MNHHFLCLITLLFALHLQADLPAFAGNIVEDNPEARALKGKDGWLFLANELKHVAKGTSWVAPETPPEPAHADPLPALKQMKEQLDELGIELLIMPVPARAVVHADMLPGVVPERSGPSGASAFLEHLHEEGFSVLNLETRYLELKEEEQVYCRTDSHWSPRGVEIAAEAVADWIQKQDWVREAETTEIRLDPPKELEIRGDLGDGSVTETLPWRRVRRADGGALISEDSPVLVLGDSHTLVFGEGADMHAQSGGFVEHLAMQLQMPVDRLANRGSASTPPRLTLFRKAGGNTDWLENKKVIIYTFAARELTESLNGWRVVPISPRFR